MRPAAVTQIARNVLGPHGPNTRRRGTERLQSSRRTQLRWCLAGRSVGRRDCRSSPCALYRERSEPTATAVASRTALVSPLRSSSTATRGCLPLRSVGRQGYRWPLCAYTRSRRLRQLLASGASQPPVRSLQALAWSRRRGRGSRSSEANREYVSILLRKPIGFTCGLRAVPGRWTVSANGGSMAGHAAQARAAILPFSW
jgi:hypothetical protein